MSDSVPKPPPTRKGLATRERILDAATELIALHGVAGTSTDQVRRVAGISGSQLYHYFDNKQALIRAVITRQADTMDPGGVPLVGPLDSLEALHAWADAAVARQGEDLGGRRCDLGTLAGELGARDDEARRDISAGFLRWQQVLLAGLRAMQAQGRLRDDADADELALAMLAALQGGALLSQTMGSATPMRSSLNSALAYVRSFTD